MDQEGQLRIGGSAGGGAWPQPFCPTRLPSQRTICLPSEGVLPFLPSLSFFLQEAELEYRARLLTGRAQPNPPITVQSIKQDSFARRLDW